MIRRYTALAAAVGMLAGPSARADEPALAQFTDGDASAGWQRYKTKDGVTLERRAVPGSPYYEHRASFTVAIDPARAAGEIWAVLRGGDMDSLQHRDILRELPDELVIHDQIHTTIVSDREYTILVTRERDPARGRTRFRCVSRPELGPPPSPHHVRMARIRAGWQTDPDGAGGTRVTYYAFSEPGGSVAAWLVRGPQATRSLADVLRLRARLRALAAR